MILPADSVPITQYDLSELLTLRRRIDELLPQSSVEDIDIASELVLAYRETKATLASAEDAPINHQSSLINTLTSQLKQLAELQRAHYNAARLQKFEKALTSLIKDDPDLLQRYKDALQ